MPKHDIKEFIDFFNDASKKIRGQDAKIMRGRDGKLTELALKKFSRTQLEMMAVWFLAKKTKLSPSVGTMLSKALMEELEERLKNHHFWKELDEIYEHYFPRQTSLSELLKRSDTSERK